MEVNNRQIFAFSNKNAYSGKKYSDIYFFYMKYFLYKI